MVGKERLELSPREGLEPKSSASTNFATRPELHILPSRQLSLRASENPAEA
jgi:hypothetical protein